MIKTFDCLIYEESSFLSQLHCYVFGVGLSHFRKDLRALFQKKFRIVFFFKYQKFTVEETFVFDSYIESQISFTSVV